jgi:perosamine synthetase
VPLYGNPVFQKYGFFAGRWPVKDLGLTSMDYTKVSCPETEAILKSCVRVTIHESMNEGYVLNVARAVWKVASYYAA